MTVDDAYSPSEGALMDALPGDVLELSQYVQEVEVQRRWVTIYGLAVVVKSTAPNASTSYRLRPTEGDDKILLEKRDGKDWVPHCRVDAELLEKGTGGAIHDDT